MHFSLQAKGYLLKRDRVTFQPIYMIYVYRKSCVLLGTLSTWRLVRVFTDCMHIIDHFSIRLLPKIKISTKNAKIFEMDSFN